MSKQSRAEYNKDTMKTLDAKALRAKKDNLQAEFENEKKQALACEDLIAKAGKKREGHLEKMSQLQGAYRVIEDLEQQIGVQLTTNEGKEKPAKL